MTGIDNVTTDNLEAALKVCGINIDFDEIDKIIDVVELLEQTGDFFTYRNLKNLQDEWNRN